MYYCKTTLDKTVILWYNYIGQPEQMQTAVHTEIEGVKRMEGNFEMFQENKSENQHYPEREVYTGPEIWMYVISVFFPVLHWIFIGAYIVRGEKEHAWSMWLKPFIFQMAVLVVGFIITLIIMLS